MKRGSKAELLVFGLCLLMIASLGAALPWSSPIADSSEFKPTMNVPVGVDINKNRISDALENGIVARLNNGSSGALANVVVMLNVEPGIGESEAFAKLDGVVTSNLWTYAVNGFAGQIPFGKINDFVNSRSDVLLVEEDVECHANVAYAARQVGARSYVWNTLGLQGDPNSSIAVLDTGIDASHPDFAPGYGIGDFSKKIVGWNNQVTSATTPFDDNGHGSHCSGLAAGDGFLSVDTSGKATATWSTNLANPGTNTYFAGGMMVNNTGSMTLTVKWSRTGSARLSS